MLAPQIRDELIDQLGREKDRDVRHRIVKRLGTHVDGDELILTTLISTSEDDKEHENVRQAAFAPVARLFGTNEQATAAAERALESNVRGVYLPAAQTIGDASQKGNAAATEIVLRNLKCPQAEVRNRLTQAAEALIRAGRTDDLTDSLVKQLHDGEVDDRLQAIDLLSAAGEVGETEPRGESASVPSGTVAAREAIGALMEHIEAFLAGHDVSDLERGFLVDLQLDLRTLDDLIARGRFDMALLLEAGRLERLGKSIKGVAVRPETVMIGGQLLVIAQSVKDLAL